jgi:uncharacterized protein involved in response to NO
MIEFRIQRPARTPVLLAYPFRPFFLLTSLYAAALVLAWVALLFGGLTLPLGVSAVQWHAHEMLFGMVPAAIAGFLLTAMCNWTGAPPLRGGGLLALVLLWLAGRLAMWLSGLLPHWLVAAVDLAFLPVLALYVGRVLLRYGNRRNLVLAAMLLALSAANVLMHVGFAGSWQAAQLGEVLALDIIALIMVVIAGRITPAFTAGWLRMNARDPALVRRSDALDRAALLTTLAMVPADLVTGVPMLGALAALAAALVNGWRLWGWRGWSAAAEPLLWILHFGVAWIVLALALKAATPWLGLAPSIWMHAMGAGAIGTLLIGVMTRVAVGHTGRPMRLPRFALGSYLAILAAGVLRMLAPWFPELSRPALMGAGIAWGAAFILFFLLYWPILSRPRVDGKPG